MIALAKCLPFKKGLNRRSQYYNCAMTAIYSGTNTLISVNSSLVKENYIF